MRYRIDFLANGQRSCHLVAASSAAAAVRLAQAQVAADGTAFELLSVLVIASHPDDMDTGRVTPA